MEKVFKILFWIFLAAFMVGGLFADDVSPAWAAFLTVGAISACGNIWFELKKIDNERSTANESRNEL